MGKIWLPVSATLLAVSGCGGEQQQSPPPITVVAPPVAPITPVAVAPFVELKYEYEAHRFSNSDSVREYTYAGVTYPASLAVIFPDTSISVDFEGDRYPEVVVALQKAYGTAQYGKLPYVLLSNQNGRLRYDVNANAKMPTVVGGFRAAQMSVGGVTSAFFVRNNSSGMYNDPKGHGTAVLLAQQSGAIAPVANAFPRLTTNPELPDDAVDAHAMAVGDINGDRLDDILIGNWAANGGGFPPVILLQQPGGRFSAINDPFLEQLRSVPTANPKSAGNEGFNLLLDLHLADLNGDNLADLVAGYGHGSAPSLLFMNKNGKFNFSERVELPSSIYGIDTNLHLNTRSSDLDNDGDLDLLVQHSRYVPYYGGNYLQLLRNDKGIFTDVTSSALLQDETDVKSSRLNWSDAVYVRDLDGDKLKDIVYCLDNGTFIVFFNKGSNKFTRLSTKFSNYGKLVDVQDYNNDGKYELLYYQYQGAEKENTYLLHVYSLNFKKP